MVGTPYPTVKLSAGESVRLDSAAFTLHRQSRGRDDRDKVFNGFFGALKTRQGPKAPRNRGPARSTEGSLSAKARLFCLSPRPGGHERGITGWTALLSERMVDLSGLAWTHEHGGTQFDSPGRKPGRIGRAAKPSLGRPRF